MAVVLVLLNALALSVGNILGGIGATRMSLTTFMAIAGPTSAVAALSYAVITPGHPSSQGLALGFVAGLLGGAGLPLAYAAFARGAAGAVGAILALTSTALIVLTGVVTGDILTPARAAGLVLCAVAVILVTYRSRSENRTRGRGPGLALLAAVLFAGFVVLIDRAPANEGMWPLVGARLGVTAVAIVLLIARASRNHEGPQPAPLRGLVVLPTLVGLLDVTGNFFLVLALQAGDLLLVAILAPAAPVFTAVIARLFLKQSLTRRQIAGLVIAVGALPFASL